MSKPIKVDLDFESAARILNLLDPTAAQHPATKAYVDALVEGLAWKDNCRVSTQGNLNLASPGSTIDGITMATGDRVLVRQQTSQPENGIYIWNGAATPATRAADCSTSNELESAVTTVDEGTDADTSWRQDTVNFTLDSGNVVWVAFGSAVAAASETTAGKAELATQAETDAGTDDARIVTPLKFKTSSLRVARHAQDVGDGSATSITVTHNFNTRDIAVFVRENSGNYRQVDCEVRVNNVNSVDLLFAAAPASNALRCIIFARG
jgi:hypothetical protein